MLHTAVHLYGSEDVPSGLLADSDSPENKINTTDAAVTVQPGDLHFAHHDDWESEHGAGLGGTGSDHHRRRRSVGERRSSESVTRLIGYAAASSESVDDHAATQVCLVGHEHLGLSVSKKTDDA